MAESHWTAETGRKADARYRAFSDAKIRRYQRWAGALLVMARARRMSAAITDLTRMSDALAREMARRYPPRKEG